MPTIGEQLKQARETRRLTIQQAMQATRIRLYYLVAMEADDFSTMPSAAQARGFLRSYAEYLGLNADELINAQRNEFIQAPPNDEVLSPQDRAAAAPADPADTPESQPVAPAQAPAPAASEPAAVEPEAAAGEPEQPFDEPPADPIQTQVKARAISQQIFFEIGHELHGRREMLSLTLDEIERHTRVRKHYLDRIEAGDFDALPSPVQARGMLSNYATFLDLDAEAILLRFADGLQARRLERQPSVTPRSSLPRAPFAPPPWLGRLISPDLLFGGAMIVLLFGLTIWGAQRIFSGGVAAGKATQGPSISDVLLASPVATVAPNDALPTSVAVVFPTSVSEATITPTAAPLQPGAASNVSITISVLERTYLLVTVDGVVKQDGRVIPGAAITFSGSQRIEILTGSGSGIHVIYNQQDQGTMGNFGEVVDRIYTPSGIETPTATSSPTITKTPRFQRTPTVTPTLTPTRTAKK